MAGLRDGDGGTWTFREGAAVPVVNCWLPAAIRAWGQLMYGRRGWWIAWGWLLLVALVLIAIKAVIFWTGVLILIVVFLLTVLWDLATYPLRRRAALR